MTLKVGHNVGFCFYRARNCFRLKSWYWQYTRNPILCTLVNLMTKNGRSQPRKVPKGIFPNSCGGSMDKAAWRRLTWFHFLLDPGVREGVSDKQVTREHRENPRQGNATPNHDRRCHPTPRRTSIITQEKERKVTGASAVVGRPGPQEEARPRGKQVDASSAGDTHRRV